MGLLASIGDGLAEVGGTVAKMGLDQFRSAVEEERQARMAELQSRIKMRDDTIIRDRNKADAEAERARVAEFTKPVVGQTNGLLSAGAGLDDPNAVGADENVGRDVQKRERAPTVAEASAAALKAGDIKSAAEIGKLDDKDAANAIKLQIAQGKYENAIQIAQIKGDFGMMIGELKAASANGSGKATELMRNWEYLKSRGYTDERAGEALLGGKVGEYVTTQTESIDSQGNKVVTTRKVKPQSESTAPQRSMMDLFPPKQTQQAPAQAASATASAAQRMTAEGSQPQPVVVNLEPAGQSMFGRKQFVATYQDGTRKVISGDDVERQAILMSK